MYRSLLFFFVFVILLFVSLLPVASQGNNVVVNGGFDMGLSHWFRTSFWGAGLYTTSEGYTALGAYAPDVTILLSAPFRASQFMSVWMKKVGCARTDAGIYNWQSGVFMRYVYREDCVIYPWQNYTASLNFPSGQWLSFYIQHGGGLVYYDDVVVLGGEMYYPTEFINGRFDDGSAYWFHVDCCVPFVLSSFEGNPPPSLMGHTVCRNTLVSMPLYVSSSNWVVDLKCGTARSDVELYLSQSGLWYKVANLNCGTSWTRNSVSLAQYVNRYASIVITYEGNGGHVWIDNVCPASGCMDSFPTPTPVLPTATPGSGGGQYPTIDWSRFPTYPPFPTFPAFPTAVYGPGTPVPVTGSVMVTGTVRIDDSTPVAVRVDDRTPVRVTFGDYVYTPVHYQNVPVSRGSLPSGSGGIPTVISHPSQSSILYGTGGSTENPVRFELASEQWSFTLPGLPGISEPFTVIMDYYYPSAFVVAGVDMLPAIYTLGAVFVVAFIIHRLKER